jgi:hypothetical protein
MGLQTDNHLFRAGYAEGAEACPTASGQSVMVCYPVGCGVVLIIHFQFSIFFISHRARRGHGRPVGASFHGALSLRRGVIRRGVILWRPVSASGRHCMTPSSTGLGTQSQPVCSSVATGKRWR